MLKTLETDTEYILKTAIWDGANIIAEEIKKNIENLPIDHGHGTDSNELQGITQTQKDGLLEGLGMTPFDNDNGFISQKIGFGGYNNLRTKRFPNGQPNNMIARWVESGTSHQRKNAFVRRSLNTSRQKAIDKVQQRMTEQVKKLQE